jgi:hypothetical protein
MRLALTAVAAFLLAGYVAGVQAVQYVQGFLTSTPSGG